MKNFETPSVAKKETEFKPLKSAQDIAIEKANNMLEGNNEAGAKPLGSSKDIALERADEMLKNDKNENTIDSQWKDKKVKVIRTSGAEENDWNFEGQVGDVVMVSKGEGEERLTKMIPREEFLYLNDEKFKQEKYERDSMQRLEMEKYAERRESEDEQKIKEILEKISSKPEKSEQEKRMEEISGEFDKNERLREYFAEKLKLDNINLINNNDRNVYASALNDFLKKYPTEKDFDSRFGLKLDKHAEQFNKAVNEQVKELYKNAPWFKKIMIKLDLFSMKPIYEKISKENQPEKQLKIKWQEKYGEDIEESHIEFTRLLYGNFDRYSLVRDQKLTNKIKQAKNFDELYKIIGSSGGIQGEKYFFSVKDLKGVINKVRFGKLGINYVTSSMGLREKVQKLTKEKKAT